MIGERKQSNCLRGLIESLVGMRYRSSRTRLSTHAPAVIETTKNRGVRYGLEECWHFLPELGVPTTERFLGMFA